MKRQKQNKKRIVIGITGSFGSGKTTVAGMLKSFGAYVIDADKLAHGCISRGNPAYERIIHTFGRGILKENRVINRKRLADVVFNNINLLIKLNNIIHPQVIRLIKDKINSSMAKVIVLDAPLLLEAGLKGLVDKLLVVKINRDAQIERIKNRMSLTKTDILKRIKSQIPLSQKLRLADFIIDNSGTIQETRKQVEQIKRRVLWKN